MRKFLLVLPLTLATMATAYAAPVATTHGTAKNVTVKHWTKKHSVVKKRPSAPADEYFGHQRLSILGVRNTIHDLNIRYDGSVQRAPMVMSVGGSLEEAMHAWALKYPGDMWLGHNMFQLDQIYMRVPTGDGKKRTDSLSDWIIHDYHGTYYDKYLTHIRQVAKERAEAQARAQVTAAPTSAPTFAPFSQSTPLDTAPAPILTSTPSPTPTSAPTTKPAPKTTVNASFGPPTLPTSVPTAIGITAPEVRPSPVMMIASPRPTASATPSPQLVVPFATPAPIPSSELIPLDPSKI